MSDEQNVQQNQDQALFAAMDHQRWLINNGFLNDMHKDQLYIFGALVHKEIQAVELSIDIEKKLVSYSLYATPALIKRIGRYKQLSKSDSVFGMWRFKRMYERDGNLDFSSIIGRFVNDYLGLKWNTSVKVASIKDYEDGYQEEHRSEQDNKQPDS